jgi:hypothetical protein
MTHYPDLTPCAYLGPEYAGACRWVGWLAAERDYPKGRLTPREHAALNRLSQKPFPVSMTFGRHQCEFCGLPLSTSDLFLPSGTKLLVAPGGILHYVEVHDYLPPQQFRRAVLECPAMDSRAYIDALLTTDWAPVARKEVDALEISLEAVLDREHRWYIGTLHESTTENEDGPATSHNGHTALTRLQKQEGYVIILVFVIWLPVYLVWVRPVFDRWLPQGADSIPTVLDVISALLLPILAALGFRAFMMWRRRYRE